jgi:hypothetical protein
LLILENDVGITEVTITARNCEENAALNMIFSKATSIICHFLVLKSVDTHLQKKSKFLSVQNKDEIRLLFRSAPYAITEVESEEIKSNLLKKVKIIFLNYINSF